MFDIGFQELVLVFVIALLVFGPEKLPEVGRTLGKWLIEIRKGIQNAKVQMEGEFEEMEKKRTEEEAETSDGKEKIVTEKTDDTETSGKEE
jgi:sec-independent protein translocase protein TatB